MNRILISSAKVISDTSKIFDSMLDDIDNAKQYIYLETYKFADGSIGASFRDKLTQKAKEGVKVRLLIDSWGSYVSEQFFEELINHGGEVKFFRKLKLSINSFMKNHERNHRKILVIDNKITYISSLNFTNYCLKWREISIRISGGIAKLFKTIFLQNFNLKNTYKFSKKRYTRPFKIGDYEIIRDVPSVIYQRLRKKIIHLINLSEKEIIIETPYFLPTRTIRDALVRAATERNVSIKIIMPLHSDVKTVDILKDYYLGNLYHSGIKILFYTLKNLHSKLFIIDNNYYIGTSNFDYRSFRYQFEVGLIGKDENIRDQLKQHINETSNGCIGFDYSKWKKRSIWQKAAELILIPLRHFL